MEGRVKMRTACGERRGGRGRGEEEVDVSLESTRVNMSKRSDNTLSHVSDVTLDLRNQKLKQFPTGRRWTRRRSNIHPFRFRWRQTTSKNTTMTSKTSNYLWPIFAPWIRGGEAWVSFRAAWRSNATRHDNVVLPVCHGSVRLVWFLFVSTTGNEATSCLQSNSKNTENNREHYECNFNDF